MPQNTSRILALIVLPLTFALSTLTGCASPGQTGATEGAEPSTSGSSPSGVAVSGENLDLLLAAEQAGVAVIADQWTNNGCSIELALGPDDIVCADILAGADLTTMYEDITGGLASLEGDPGAVEAVRTAFASSSEAGLRWSSAGCAVELTVDCADEGEQLITALLALDAAFDAWSA